MKFRICRVSETDDQTLKNAFYSADEHRRAKILDLRRAEDQKQRLCADSLARQMLSEQCAIAPSALQFAQTDNGKPFALNCQMQFNLSHSGDFVLCAIDSRPIGADIEVLREVKPSLIRRVCTPEEIGFIGTDSKRFMQIWTAKEALLKYHGTGIREDLRQVRVVADGKIQLLGLNLHTALTDEYALAIVYE